DRIESVRIGFETDPPDGFVAKGPALYDAARDPRRHQSYRRPEGRHPRRQTAPGLPHVMPVGPTGTKCHLPVGRLGPKPLKRPMRRPFEAPMEAEIHQTTE